MYKFLGKKGQLYKFDTDGIVMKLNWKCPKGTVDETFKCGNTPAEAKKNYNRIRKEKKAIKSDKKVTKDAVKKSKLASNKIKKISDPALKTSVDNVKTLIDKVKAEKKSGKVSKETYNALKTAVSDLKKVNTSSKSTKPQINTVKPAIDSNNIIDTMQPGEIWNAGLVGDVKIESVKGDNITVTANGKTETMTKNALYNALKEFNITKKSTNSNNISSGNKTSNKNIYKITSKLDEISKITDPIERQQFISNNPKLKLLEKYQKSKEKEKKATIKGLKDKIKEIYKNEKDSKVAEKKELKILNKLEPLQGEYKNSPIKYWEDSSILEYYSSEHYATVNKSLDSKERSEKCSEFTKRLSSIIESNKVESDITTFRGISDSAYEKLVSNGMKVGSEIECPRFTSTSKNIAVAYDFAVSNQKNKDSKINIIKCDIPKGTNAMDMTKHVNNAYYEEEILLNAGQKFKIDNIEENDKYRIIHWKVV